MHKYIHEYDNEWGYFVKLDDDIDEEKYIIIDEYKEYKYAATDEECKYEEYKYKNINEDKEDKKLVVQYNKHKNINKSLFIYFVVTILIYISYTFSIILFHYKNNTLQS